ncbi:hypothetical protein KY284_024221 [Solanum tuberosum]|nr:hypothetical protein KY284_024221 [Solanum tuberosum]
MNGFTLITLRWYHGGVLELSSGEPIYNGGKVTIFLDVDVDKMSYFELKDYIRELGYSTTCTFSIKAPNNGILVDVDNDKDILDMMCSLADGDEMKVFVRHLADEAIVGPMLIENGSHVDMGESGLAFNTRPSESENFNFGVSEDHLNSEDHVATFSTSPHFTTTPPFTTATDDDIDVAELVGDDDEEEYGSDEHEEVRELRAEKRGFQRRKRRERVAADNEEVPVGEAGLDLGFDEIGTSKVSHEGRLGGDEPYFASSDDDSFELDEDKCCNDDEHESDRSRRVKLSRKRSSKTQKIIHDPTAKKVVWQLGMVFKDAKEFRQAVTKYAVRRRVQVEKWVNEPKKVREVIRKKFKLRVGKTTVRRARAKVLKDIMGDHVVKFRRILDYNDELKCIGLDGCFLKGVCKCQLLVPVARDGNNQMLPLAWAVVEKKNKHTWTMFVKCIRDDLGLGDGEENNMSECFNAWILAARHKTIITMLEEIRVKMMTRIGNLREFPSTWKCNFSPMALKVLEENISRSMDCTIDFNGAAGFEVKEGLCQHKVEIARRTCSCRVWQLRGIPCAHAVAALYFKKFSLYDYIDNCYSKETYLRTYANVIEPLTNMEMWLVSTNPTIEPPEITNMPGRPPKARRKEAGETKKSGKIPRTGFAMTCSVCHVRGHNKKGCPQREGVESSTRQSVPSPTASGRAEPTGSGRGRGKPNKTPSTSSEGEPPLKKRRGRPKKTLSVAPSAPPLPTAPTDFPASSSAPPTYHVSSSIAGTTKRGTGRGRGNTSLEKRPRVMGMGVFQVGNGFKVMNYEWMTRLLVVDEVLHINTSFN